MKFSTTPLLLTSLALSSASSLAAPLPSSQSSNNLEIRSPNPDEFESPLLGGSKSPFLGGNGASDDRGGKGWGKVPFEGKGHPRASTMGGPLGRSWSMKRQLATSTSNSPSTLPASPPLAPDVQAETQNVQSQTQGLVQGLQTGLNGLPQTVNVNNLPNLGTVSNTLGGLGLGASNQALGLVQGIVPQGTVNGALNGVIGTVGGLTSSGAIPGLGSTIGGLTNGGALNGLTGTVGGLTGTNAGSTLNSLTGQLGGLTNGLPIVNGLSNGLGSGALGGLGTTLNGLTGSATGTFGGALSGSALGGVTSTLGGLGLGDPTKQLSGVTGALGGLTGTIGTLSTPANDGTSSLSSAPGGVQSSITSTGLPVGAPSMQQMTGVVSNPASQLGSAQAQSPSVSSLGNIVQSLGGNTYLLSSGQVISLPTQLQTLAGQIGSSLPSSTQTLAGPAQSATGSLDSLLGQGLSIAQVNGRMYVLNSVGQAIAALPDSTKIGNVSGLGIGSYYQLQDEQGEEGTWGGNGRDPNEVSDSTDPSPNTSSNSADYANGEEGYNSPYAYPPTSEPSATDLIAQAISGTEPTSAYSSALPVDPFANSDAPYGRHRTATQMLVPTATSTATSSSTATTTAETAAITAPVQAASGGTGDDNDEEWYTASNTLGPGSSITASVGAADNDDTWGDWVSATPTAMVTPSPTTLWAGAVMGTPTGSPTGAVGSEMVPQMSSGLA